MEGGDTNAYSWASDACCQVFGNTIVDPSECPFYYANPVDTWAEYGVARSHLAVGAVGVVASIGRCGEPWATLDGDTKNAFWFDVTSATCDSIP